MMFHHNPHHPRSTIMSAALSKFRFSFCRFTGIKGQRTTELIRDYTQADGMRGLVDRSAEHIQLATERALDWASSKG
jgi:hypothetical protein